MRGSVRVAQGAPTHGLQSEEACDMPTPLSAYTPAYTPISSPLHRSGATSEGMNIMPSGVEGGGHLANDEAGVNARSAQGMRNSSGEIDSGGANGNNDAFIRSYVSKAATISTNKTASEYAASLVLNVESLVRDRMRERARIVLYEFNLMKCFDTPERT